MNYGEDKKSEDLFINKMKEEIRKMEKENSGGKPSRKEIDNEIGRLKVKSTLKNTKQFTDFHRRQLALSRETQKNAQKLKLDGNLEKWINMLPNFLKNATPSNLPSSVISRMRELKFKEPYDKSCIISTNSNHVGLFTAYSLIYALIRSGEVTPSQVKTTTALEAYSNIHGMFEAKKWKENFFSPDGKVLLIENCSREYSLTAPRGEEQFWQELFEFNRYNDKFIIVTYKKDNGKEEDRKNTFIPSVISNFDMNKNLILQSKFIMLSGQEEQEIGKYER